jgi:solute carrier family 35 (UDP-sugar transporter), member A1/2/3
MQTNLLSIRTVILVALCLQNACYTLIRKYSTKYEDVSSKEILIVSELIKIVFSVYMIMNESDSTKSDSQGEGVNKLVWLLQHSGKMFILALIYGAMNILSFVALQYIGAGEFTICAQLKILTTAGFSVIVLKNSLSATKWRALALLVLGCILVASPSFKNSGSSSTEGEAGGLGYFEMFGYIAVLTEVVLSGFASI